MTAPPSRPEELRAWLDRLAADRLVPIAETFGEQHAVCRELVAAMADAGVLGLTLPEAYGGTGGDDRYSALLCTIRETFGYHHPLVDFTYGLQGLGSVAILRLGSEAQRRRYLPGLADGSTVFSFALTEPGAGSDVLGMRTTATPVGGGFVLDGEKTFISGAPDADVYLVLARSDGTERGSGITAFIVERGTPGFSAVADIDLAAPHAIGSLRFQGCQRGSEHVVGELHRGLRAAFGTLEVYRPSVGALAVGSGRRALDIARAAAGERVAFGRPLVALDVIRAKLGRARAQLVLARALVSAAADARDAAEAGSAPDPARTVSGDPATLAAMAKLRATEVALEVIYEAQQILGGRGVLAGTHLDALSRHLRAATIYEGTSEIQRGIIARRELHRTSDEAGAVADPGPSADAEVRGHYEAVLRRIAAASDLAAADTLRLRLADAAVAVHGAELVAAEGHDAQLVALVRIGAADAVAGLATAVYREAGAISGRELDRTLAALRAAAPGAPDQLTLAGAEGPVLR